MGRVAVPKTGQKNASPRGDGSEVLVGRVAVPKTGQKPPFATPGWLWSTCGQGPRAKDRLETPSPRRDGSGVLVGRVAVPSRL